MKSSVFSYKNKVLIALCLTLALLTACKKDKCNDVTNPKCENYDPCYKKISVDASFRIYENIGDVAVEADTIWINSPLILWARNRPGTNFTWRVRTQGYGFTTTDSMVTIFCSAQLPPMPTAQFYTVTCIATKDAGSCTTVKKTDSTSKVFYMWPKEYIGNWTQIHYLPVFGTYAGYKQSNPSQLVYVTIFDTILTPSNMPCNGQAIGLTQNYDIIRNLAYNHFSSENFTFAYGGTIKNKGASGFFLQSHNLIGYNQSGCYGSRYLVDYAGIATVDLYNSKKINIAYTYWDTVSWQPVNDYFTGLKTN